MYIYDLLILTKGDWIDHVQNCEFTINKLKGKGLKCDIEKYFLGQIKMENLGLWVTHDGSKPINKKIETTTNMKPPPYQK